MNADNPPMPDPGGLRVGPIFIPEDALQLNVSHSSGPGGQNVNKQNTRIELRLALADMQCPHPLVMQRLRTLAGKRINSAGELRIVCQQTRSLEQNRQQALLLLQALLEEATHLPTPRRRTRPTRGSRQRRITAKKHRADIKSHRRSDNPL